MSSGLSDGAFLNAFPEWLDIQNGANPAPASNLPRDLTRRFIRNGRDLGHLVRPNRAYQHYLNAALILMSVDPFFAQYSRSESTERHGSREPLRLEVSESKGLRYVR